MQGSFRFEAPLYQVMKKNLQDNYNPGSQRNRENLEEEKVSSQFISGQLISVNFSSSSVNSLVSFNQNQSPEIRYPKESRVEIIQRNRS